MIFTLIILITPSHNNALPFLHLWPKLSVFI